MKIKYQLNIVNRKYTRYTSSIFKMQQPNKNQINTGKDAAQTNAGVDSKAQGGPIVPNQGSTNSGSVLAAPAQPPVVQPNSARANMSSVKMGAPGSGTQHQKTNSPVLQTTHQKKAQEQQEYQKQQQYSKSPIEQPGGSALPQAPAQQQYRPLDDQGIKKQQHQNQRVESVSPSKPANSPNQREPLTQQDHSMKYQSSLRKAPIQVKKQDFQQLLTKISLPKNTKQKDIQKAFTQFYNSANQRDWQRLADILNIRDRIKSMYDMSSVLQNQNSIRKEVKIIKKEMQRNQSNNSKNRNRRPLTPENQRTQRQNSVFSHESSTLSGEDISSNLPFGDDSDMNGKNSKFPYPYCLSSIILGIQDILQNPKILDNLKDDHQAEIIRLVELCLQEQKCLIYLMPFFTLNFLTSTTLTKQYSRLQFLKMITKNGRIVNKAFNSKIFLVLLNMIDPERIRDESMKDQYQDQIFDFLKTFLDYNPDCFSSTQTLILLTRICLVGFIAMSSRTELSLEVLQIIQFLLKYNKSSSTHNMENLAVLALSILVTNQSLKNLAWNVMRHLIVADPDRIVHEILEILMIGNNQQENVTRMNQDVHEFAQPFEEHTLIQQRKDQQIILELYLKCFNQTKNEFLTTDLEEIDNDIKNKHKSCLFNQFKEMDPALSVDELICKLEFPNFFRFEKQAFQIIEFDMTQFHFFRNGKLQFIKHRLELDRQELIDKLESNLDVVKWGAVYFLGMTLYSTDSVPECSYSINRILEVFRQVLINTKSYQLVGEIILSILQLLHYKHIQITFEWDQLLDIIDTLFRYHSPILIAKKRLPDIDRIFKCAQDQILLDKYQRDEVRVLKLYVNIRQKYMQNKAFRVLEHQMQFNQVEEGLKPHMRNEKGLPMPNMVLLSLYIDHILDEEFEQIDQLTKSLFLHETNDKVQMLLLEKLHQFYKANFGDKYLVQRIERLLLKVLENILKKPQQDSQIVDDYNYAQQLRNRNQNQGQNEGFNQSIQLKAIDLIAYMAHKCDNMERFHQMISFLGKALIDKSQAQHQQQLQQHQAFVNHNFIEAEMTPNEVYSIKRLIQIFKLKSTTTESYKSISVLGLLLDIFKHDSLQKRDLILSQIIQNIKINKHGDLCWMSFDFPLMIGFTEYYRINCCPQCPHEFENELEMEESKVKELEELSQKMVLPLQHLINCLLSQQTLGNDRQAVLDFKLNCLKTTKNLLIDLYSSEAALHQTLNQDEKNHVKLAGYFNMNTICQLLVNCIDINTNFQCTQQIYEIFYILIGSQNYTHHEPMADGNLISLQLSEQQHEQILKCILKGIRQSFGNYHQKEEHKFDRKDHLQRLTQFLGKDNEDDLTNSDRRPSVQVSSDHGRKLTQNLHAQTTRQSEVPTKPGMHDSIVGQIQSSEKNDLSHSRLSVDVDQKKQILGEIYQPQADGRFKQSNSFKIQESVQSLEQLEVLQRTLSLLGFYLQCDCTKIKIDEDQVNADIQAQQEYQKNISIANPDQFNKTFQKSLLMMIIELLYDVCESDQTLHHVTFQVLRVLQGMTKLYKQKEIHNEFICEMIQFLLYRIAIPKIIVIANDFQSIRTMRETQYNRYSQFLQFILMNSIQQVDPKTNIFAYQDSPQTQILLDLVTNIQIDIFSLNCDFYAFEVLQNFFDQIKMCFEKWHYNQVITCKIGIQELFLRNLSDLLQWTLNSNSGKLKRHLLFGAHEPYKKDPQFFVLNQSIIEINRFEKDVNKFKIMIYNSSYNFEMIYEVNNPQQDLKNNTSLDNKILMQEFLLTKEDKNRGGGNSTQRQPIIDIDQRILLQAIHPITVNKMKRSQKFFKITDYFKPMCINKCIQLERLAPFNMNFVFVSSYYTDGQTAKDFMSRLGNFEKLKDYQHYYKDLDPETQDYINTLNGIVYDKDLTDIYIFISDILIPGHYQQNSDSWEGGINYFLLQTIKNLQTIFLSSMTPLKDKSIQNCDSEQIYLMHSFMRNQMKEQKTMKIFKLNSRQYIVSDSLIAQSHVADFKNSKVQTKDVFNTILSQRSEENGRGVPYKRQELFDEAVKQHPAAAQVNEGDEDQNADVLQKRRYVFVRQKTNPQGDKEQEDKKQGKFDEDNPDEEFDMVDAVKRDSANFARGSLYRSSKGGLAESMMFEDEDSNQVESIDKYDNPMDASIKSPGDRERPSSAAVEYPKDKSAASARKQASASSESSSDAQSSHTQPQDNAMNPQNPISQILQFVPQVPIYDHMMIQNEQIGNVIRHIIKERRHYNEQEQYRKKMDNYQIPRMLHRSMILQELITQIKYSGNGIEI